MGSADPAVVSGYFFDVSLRMPRALEALDHVARQLERGETNAIEAIETLLAQELTIRESRRAKGALQMARLTPIKTLSGFDFSFQPSLEPSRVTVLAWRSPKLMESNSAVGG